MAKNPVLALQRSFQHKAVPTAGCTPPSCHWVLPEPGQAGQVTCSIEPMTPGGPCHPRRGGRVGAKAKLTCHLWYRDAISG